MSEMYADYLDEIGVKKMFYNDKGFAIYSISGPDCYIEDIYVKPEFRDQDVTKHLQASIMEVAKEKGCTRLLGSVIPTYRHSSKSLSILLKDGYKVESATLNFILVSKEIS